MFMSVMRTCGSLTFLQVDQFSIKSICVVWGLRPELGTRVLTALESTRGSSATLPAE